MNEIQLLREQLAAEERHVREVAAACAAAYAAAPEPAGDAALGALAHASAEYLGCVLGWFDARDARLGALQASRQSGTATVQAPAALAANEGGSAALARLDAAADAGAAWTGLVRFIEGPWDARRRFIAALLDSLPRVSDWRQVAAIDADSIYRERALYEQVRAALPAGLTLG